MNTQGKGYKALHRDCPFALLEWRYAAQFGVSRKIIRTTFGAEHLVRMTPLARRVMFGSLRWEKGWTKAKGFRAGAIGPKAKPSRSLWYQGRNADRLMELASKAFRRPPQTVSRPAQEAIA